MKFKPNKNLPPTENPSQKELIEGVHYYLKDGLFVLTEKYLKERGQCCSNGCLHCPYPIQES